jgi:hypothetical protein
VFLFECLIICNSAQKIIKWISHGQNMSVAGGEGFEPSTPNLGGWCSIRAMGQYPSTPHFGGCYRNIAIRTELLAHVIAKVNLAKQIPIDQLLKIDKAAILLVPTDSFLQKIQAPKRRKHLIYWLAVGTIDGP